MISLRLTALKIKNVLWILKKWICLKFYNFENTIIEILENDFLSIRENFLTKGLYQGLNSMLASIGSYHRLVYLSDYQWFFKEMDNRQKQSKSYTFWSK